LKTYLTQNSIKGGTILYPVIEAQAEHNENDDFLNQQLKAKRVSICKQNVDEGRLSAAKNPRMKLKHKKLS